MARGSLSGMYTLSLHVTLCCCDYCSDEGLGSAQSSLPLETYSIVNEYAQTFTPQQVIPGQSKKPKKPYSDSGIGTSKTRSQAVRTRNTGAQTIRTQFTELEVNSIVSSFDCVYISKNLYLVYRLITTSMMTMPS